MRCALHRDARICLVVDSTTGLSLQRIAFVAQISLQKSNRFFPVDAFLLKGPDRQDTRLPPPSAIDFARRTTVSAVR